MHLIVGLGNPGPEYVFTRHNVGWNVLDQVVEDISAGSSTVKFGGQCWGPLNLRDDRLFLMKPLTYMNESGVAVGEFARFYRIPPECILVIYDDVDLPVGHLRLRPEGSAGGHNGMKSVISHLGTLAFPRLRVGTGTRPDGRDMVGYVLGKFPPQERVLIDHAILQAARFALEWCTSDLNRLMSKVNRYKAEETDGEA